LENKEKGNLLVKKAEDGKAEKYYMKDIIIFIIKEKM